MRSYENKAIRIVDMVFVLLLFTIVSSNPCDSFGCYYEHDPIYGCRALKFINYLFPQDVLGKSLIRVGNQWDGGYSMLDDFGDTRTAYGFGVGRDWSWDLDLAFRGIDVFMFDPTISTPRINNLHLKFYSLGIAASDIPEKKMMSLESILKLDDNLNKTNMILKIDIEGGEVEVLFHMKSSTLEKFSQILIEFHRLEKVLLSGNVFSMGLAVLEKLNKTHQLVWIHPCNIILKHYVFGGIPFPQVFEVAYVKRTENMKFTEPKKRKRTDERSWGKNAEVLLWWLEGQKVNIVELLNQYEAFSYADKIRKEKKKRRSKQKKEEKKKRRRERKNRRF